MMASAALVLLFHFQLLQLPFSLAAAPAPKPHYLNITTIAANNQKQSIFECWQLTAPFVASAAAGTSGAAFVQLGETGATSYGLIPANFNGGLHNAPVVQYVAFIAGEAVISFPNSTATATIQGGRNGLILAADTANVSTYGHITKYPSKQETIGIQIPTANNEVPDHTILHEGPCVKNEENNR